MTRKKDNTVIKSVEPGVASKVVNTLTPDVKGDIVTTGVEEKASEVLQPTDQEKAFKVAEMTATSVESLSARLADFTEAPKVPPMEEVKKKRGRKPGSKVEKPPIENFTPKPEQQVFAGAVISGIILLTIVDAFIPWLIVAFHNKYNKGVKMTAKELQLPSDIKKELGAVADEVIKTSNIKISPTSALLFSLVAAYGTAYMAATTRKPTQSEMKVNK